MSAQIFRFSDNVRCCREGTRGRRSPVRTFLRIVCDGSERRGIEELERALNGFDHALVTHLLKHPIDVHAGEP